MRRELRLASWCAAAMLPLATLAAPVSTQEFADAVRTTPEVERGAQLFETCAACHGVAGAGTEDGLAPRIAGQHFGVVVKQLVDYRHGKRWDIRMAQIASSHHPPDAQSIADVSAYVSRLDLSASPGIGSGEIVGHGSEVYGRRCQSCHGPAGEGNAERRVPQIAAQHYEYLLRQMHDAIESRRPNFPRAHVRLLSGLARDDLLGMADYLSRTMPSDARRRRPDDRRGSNIAH